MDTGTAIEKVIMPDTVRVIVREVARLLRKISIDHNKIRTGQDLHAIPLKSVLMQSRGSVTTTSLQIVTVMSIARPIRDGRNAQKRGGNQIEIEAVRQRTDHGLNPGTVAGITNSN
jgi:hypothetical protein